MPLRATVILNSSAGTGCSTEQVEDLRARFTAAGIDADITLALDADEILDAVDGAVAAGVRLVVAGGGDGTQAAVASRLAGRDAVQGVLPMGTLNHFAKDLGIPLDLDEAIRTMATGRETAVDLGEVNGRIFINNSSLGLYPDIVLDRERQRSRLGKGKWQALLSASLNAARRVPTLDVHVRLDGRDIVRQTPFVFVGNNAYTMEGFSIGARASLTGGELSLYMTQRTGPFALLRLALRALFHRLDQARDFDRLQAKAFVVQTRRAHERVATDGEVTLMKTPLSYRVRPKALRVMVPAA